MAKNRSLDSINNKLFKGSSSLQAAIHRLLERHRPVSVLEVGCGAGRALMELALEFHREPVTFHAINKEPGKPLASNEDLRRVARDYGVAWEGDGAEWPLPQLYFYDATTLQFPDDSIDLIYLSTVARFMARKAEFVEEVCRVLRPGGTAIVQLSRSGWDYPHAPARDGLLLTAHPSRFVLTYGDELVPLQTYLRSFGEKGFDFDFVGAPGCVIQITKRRAGKLALGLEYDDERSVPMNRLPYGQDDVREVRGGFRSVYRISKSRYDAMCDHLAVEQSGRESDGVRLRRSPTGSAEGPRERTNGSTTRARALACFHVGQRVKVKGTRAEGRCFRAAKIRANDDGQEWEQLEGAIEWVDATNGTFGMLGCTVCVGADRPLGGIHDGVGSGELPLGTLVKVSGRFHDGHFAPHRLTLKQPQAVVVDEIQGAIQAIDLADASLEVAGFIVRVDDQTKVVTD
jgi:SAM-dependent methyltransferase